MRSRTLVAALFVQALVPCVALVNGVPSRFGFHMFATGSGLSVVVQDRAGTVLPLNLDELVVGRPELDWTPALPELVCATVTGAYRVTVTQGSSVSTSWCSR